MERYAGTLAALKEALDQERVDLGNSIHQLGYAVGQVGKARQELGSAVQRGIAEGGREILEQATRPVIERLNRASTAYEKSALWQGRWQGLGLGLLVAAVVAIAFAWHHDATIEASVRSAFIKTAEEIQHMSDGLPPAPAPAPKPAVKKR